MQEFNEYFIVGGSYNSGSLIKISKDSLEYSRYIVWVLQVGYFIFKDQGFVIYSIG